MMICNLCNQVLSGVVHERITHIARCVFDISFSEGIPCPCTCTSCRGTQIHPAGQILHPQKKRKDSNDAVNVRVVPDGNEVIHMIATLLSPLLPAGSLKALVNTSKTMFSVFAEDMCRRMVFSELRFDYAIKLYKNMKNVKIQQHRSLLQEDDFGEFVKLEAEHVTMQMNAKKRRFYNYDIPNVDSLTVKCGFSGSLPQDVKTLSIDMETVVDSDGNLLHPLPNSVKSLTLTSTDFTKLHLPPFPPKLTSIQMQREEYRYMWSAKDFKRLPQTLKKLSGVAVNGSTRSVVLPRALTHLDIFQADDGFKMKLPNTLQYLKAGGLEAPLQLPAGLKSLQLPFDDFLGYALPLPPNLEELTVRKLEHPLSDLPSKLREFFVLEGFDLPLEQLPSTLRRLGLGNSFNQPLINLPPLLTHLYLGDGFKESLYNLPLSLTHLGISSTYPHPLDILPKHLEYLKVTINSASFDQLATLPPHLNLDLDLDLRLRSTFWSSAPPSCVHTLTVEKPPKFAGENPGKMRKFRPVLANVCFWVDHSYLPAFDMTRPMYHLLLRKNSKAELLPRIVEMW